MEPRKNEQIKMIIYPSSGGLSGTYYFSLNTDDGELIAEEGTRDGVDLTQSTFIKKDGGYDFESKKIILSSSEISKVVKFTNKIYKDNSHMSNEIINDSWAVQILYKNKLIKQNYFVDIPVEVKELVDEFIYISPIKVDLHGWS